MSRRSDTAGDRLGMWLFLLSEMLLFGGLFILYAAYLRRYPLEFHAGAGELSVFFGSLNTVILLTSSLCAAVAVAFLNRNVPGHCVISLGLTAALGLVFLVNKFFEWGAKFSHGTYPNSPKLAASPPGDNIFYALYFFMTGLHGLHVLIGVGVILVTATMVKRGSIHQGNSAFLFNAALYWHLVDVIWIYLFPLLYLIT